MLSHYQYHPWSWLPEPATPVWVYRVTQGVHVATGTATIPLLLVKLWSVYPNLFRWPPVKSGKNAARAALGGHARLVRTGAAVHRVLQRAELVPVVVGLRAGPPVPGLRRDRLDPAAHRDQAARHQVRAEDQDAPRATSSPRSPGATTPRRTATTTNTHQPPPTPTGISRRGADRGHRRRHRGRGCHQRRADRDAARADRAARDPPIAARARSDVPVNRTADQAQVRELAAATGSGSFASSARRPYVLTLAELEATSPSTRASFPISCVEGWSVGAHWRGLRLLDVVTRAGGSADSRVKVVSLEPQGFLQPLLRRRSAGVARAAGDTSQRWRGSTSTTAIRCA